MHHGTIYIQRPSDNLSLKVYEEVMQHAAEFSECGAELKEAGTQRFAPDLPVGIAVAVVGAIVSQVVKKLIDLFFTSAREHDHYSLTVTILHHQTTFLLPRETTKCLEHFETQEQPGQPGGDAP